MNAIRLISSAVRLSPIRSNDHRSNDHHSNAHRSGDHNVVRLRRPPARTDLACVLACRWQQGPDGRLTCVWQHEPLDSSPNRHLCLVAG